MTKKNIINKYKNIINSFNATKKSKEAKIKQYPMYSECVWEGLLYIQEAEMGYWTNWHEEWHDTFLTANDYATMGYNSAYGSKYWYTEKYLYRLANHWGSVASCYWWLKSPFFRWSNHIYDYDCRSYEWVLARVKWEDIKFIPIEERNPFYLIQRLEEWKKEALLEKGLVSVDTECGERVRWHVETDYRSLQSAIAKL